MISDLTIAESVYTLQEYYDRVYVLQSGAHQPDYMLVHDEIKEKMGECDSYTELGVNQGATLAAAVLQNPKVVRAYDISLMPYNRAKSLFNDYAMQNDIDYEVHEDDTLKIVLDKVDLLYIDTLHRYEHLTNELALHADKVNKYIVFHDTHAMQGLKRAVNEFVLKSPNWKIVTDCQDNVGFMTVKRINE